MEIWHGLDSVPADFGDAVVTIGVFDGVHKGHKTLVRSAVADARARGVKSIMMTFDPNPVALFAPDKVPAGLSTVARRAELAAAEGIDAMLVIAFDKAFASIEPEDFVRVVLGAKLRAKVVYVGENFTYGKMAKGTAETMPAHGEKFGIDVTIVPLLDVEAAALPSASPRPACAGC